MQISGKAALVVGGASGMAKATAEMLVREGARVSILDHKGNIVARLGKDPTAGNEPGKFLAPHSLMADSRGDLYVGEVAVTGWPSLFPGVPQPRILRSIQKFVRVPAGTTA